MKYQFLLILTFATTLMSCDVPTSSFETSTQMNSNQRVTLYDQTHQMAMGSFSIPSDWQFQHDIASKIDAPGFHRYMKQILGPNGEVVINLQIGSYNQLLGTHFQGALGQNVRQSLGRFVQNISLGQISTSADVMNSKSFKSATQKAPGLKALEVPFTGQREGKEVNGMVYIALMDQGQFGMFFGDVLFSSSDRLTATKRVYFMTGDTYEENPQYVQIQNQVQQRLSAQQQQMAAARSQQSYQAHQQRMAMRQQAFNAHQNRMQQNSQMMDQNHQQWMSNFRSTGNTTTNGYSSHNAYVDAIHERQSFNDPYSGQEVHKDGYHQYNYTNGLGDYYQTNDPSFNASSLQGNWQEISPNQVTR